ncbi:MAG: hypothetical protein V3V19_11370 [Cocleimonas sp.]
MSSTVSESKTKTNIKTSRLARFFMGRTLDSYQTNIDILSTQIEELKSKSSITNQLQNLFQAKSNAIQLEKSKSYINVLSSRQNYYGESGEIVSFPSEAYDQMVMSMMYNSTARQLLQARTQEITRNGLQITSKFSCKCPVCNVDYDQITESCDNCGNTEDIYPFIFPSESEKEIGEEWIDASYTVNTNNQHLIDIIKENQRYVDMVDDMWVLVENDYILKNGLIVFAEVKQLWVVHPANIAWSVEPKTNRIGTYEYTCVDHRKYSSRYADGLCDIDNCNNFLYPVIAYGYEPGTNTVITKYIQNEILHSSLHSPSALYGYPPAVTLRYELSLTTNQLKHMSDYYDDTHYHKLPGYLLLPTASSWEDVWEEAKKMRRILDKDANAIGILPYEPSPGGAKPEFVKFDTSPVEMEFIAVRDESKDSMGAFFGVSRIFRGDVSQGGGLNNEGLQFTVTNRAIATGQNAWNLNILGPLSKLIGLNDWVIELAPSEEQDEVAEVELKTKKALYVAIMVNQLRFDRTLDSNNELQVIEREKIEDPYADLFTDDPANYQSIYPTKDVKQLDIDKDQQAAADKYQGAPGYPNVKKMAEGDNKAEGYEIIDSPILKNNYYTFVDEMPEWEWEDDYELTEFRTVERGEIQSHPDYEIKEEDIKNGSPRVRAGTIIYYLTEKNEMQPLIVDSNLNLLDGNHRKYVLDKKEQETVRVAVVRAKEGANISKKMQAKQQLRAPKGGLNILGEFYKGGKFIPEDIINQLNDIEKETIRRGGKIEK